MGMEPMQNTRMWPPTPILSISAIASDTVAIDTANVHGVRITPHVYTTTAELDTFVRALKELAAA
jgi:selenocysteine lyase/cysteine desulfurase